MRSNVTAAATEGTGMSKFGQRFMVSGIVAEGAGETNVYSEKMLLSKIGLL